MVFVIKLRATMAEQEARYTETLTNIFDCIHFAAIKHANQRRKDPEETPYINHPIGKHLLNMNFSNCHSGPKQLFTETIARTNVNSQVISAIRLFNYSLIPTQYSLCNS